MNRRQKLKHLKNDNKFMRDIINRTPEMKWLYDAYHQPCNVTYSTMSFQEYRVRRSIPRYMDDLADYTDHIKRALTVDLAEVIAKDVRFEPVEICGEKAIEASIYIGRK